MSFKVEKEDAVLQLVSRQCITQENFNVLSFPYRMSLQEYNEHGDCVVLKQFSTYVENPEEVIASALFEAHKYSLEHGGIPGSGESAFINTYYADGYSFYTVKNGKVCPDVTSYAEVKNFDLGLIQKFFEDYLNERKEPVIVPDLTTSLKTDSNASQDTLRTCSTDRKKWSSDNYTRFIIDVKEHPENYSEFARDWASICEVRDFCDSDNKREKYIAELIYVWLPEKYWPLNLVTYNTDFSSYDINGVINGEWVNTHRRYDEWSVEKYGQLSKFELANVLVSEYLKKAIEPEFDNLISNTPAL